MRRFFVAAFLLLFVCQSSGVAMAATVPTAPLARPFLADVELALTQSLHALSGTYIGALLTGRAAQYQAMHQSAPTIPHVVGTPLPRQIFERFTRAHFAVRQPYREGLPGHPPHLAAPLATLHPQAFRSLHSVSTKLGVQTAALLATQDLVVKGTADSTTGINRWWTYEQGTSPGVGRYMVNTANGNLIVQSDDADVPERGIDLAFRRTYNSQSLYDWSQDDGAQANPYGAGWTNTFDAHITNGASGAITVFDIDGARYDYTPNAQGGFDAPAGMQGTKLQSDGACGYQWIKKSGTIYDFWGPSGSQMGSCYNGSNIAYAGRLSQIFGRNHNNVITFSYFWDNGDASTEAHLSKIVAQHSDGQSLTLTFQDDTLSSGTERLLASLTRPDGFVITYEYDSIGNLIAALEPGNGSWNNQARMLWYGYYDGTHRMLYTSSPRWANNSNWGNEGGYISYDWTADNRVLHVNHVGYSNFVPTDGTNTLLQPSVPASPSQYGTLFLQEVFSYPSSTETDLTDTDGHATDWHLDGSGRVTETQEWTGAPNNLWFTTYASWDGNNNVTETVDARGDATDYGYDGNGNTTWVQQPTVTTSLGSGRPLARYSYDQYNNLLAYCDPQYIWTTGATTCPSTSGATHYTWNYSDTNEPYGYLTDAYTPLGYHKWFSYNTNAQGGGDYGLPTDVNSDCISQADGTSRCPHQGFAYDSHGNMTYYGPGIGNWTLSYDSLNRQLVATDPDNVSSYTCYYQNGQIQYTETASQHVADGSPSACQATAPANAVAYGYDPDGNAITETHHYGGATGVTQKWYDGADRLVEVMQPKDPNGNDYYSYAWMTRYIYDLAQGGNVSVDGASFRAYGNLYKTQEYLPSNPIVSVSSGPASPIWQDVRGTSFDALDRALASYENAFGSTAKLLNTYDGNGYYGLLTETQNAVGQQSTLTYDATGAVYQKQYQNDGGVTPWMTYTYDPDGRAVTLNSSQFGSQTQTYDADGHLTRVVEPSSGGYTSPATISYDYYGDGLRKDLSVTSAALTQTNLFQYSYRTDGALQKQQVNGAVNGAFAWTYSNAGRELTQSDPYTGRVITLYNTKDAQTGQTRTLQAKTYTYDGYGRVSSLVLPEGYTYNGFTYDADDETTGYARSNAYCANFNTITTTCMGTRGQTYTVRAELTKVTDPSASATAGNGPSADGTMVSSTLTQFDARSGMVTGMTSKNFSSQSHNVGGTLAYAHDGAGRQTTLTENYTYGSAETAYATRGYDAENHVVSQLYTGATFMCADSLTMCGQDQSGTLSGVVSGTRLIYGWGPNGHPILFQKQVSGTTSMRFSAHWDGDDVLFGASPTNEIDLEIGKLGATNEGTYLGMTVTDRDMTGAEVATHNGSSFSAWSSAPPTRTYKVLCNGCKTEDGFVSGAINSDYDQYATATQYLATGRTDGYDDGYGNTFQGVRAYDQNTSQWTAPDAYAGDIHDPMSQKPFMWNNNNPIAYSDPSGYLALFGPIMVPQRAVSAVAQALHQMVVDILVQKAVGDLGNAIDLTRDALRGSENGTPLDRNVTSDRAVTIDEANVLGRAAVGKDATVAKDAAGNIRMTSANGRITYRVTQTCLGGKCGPPHVHLDVRAPNSSKIVQTIHIPIKPN